MRKRIVLSMVVSLVFAACAAGTEVGSGSEWGSLAVTDFEGGGDALMVGELSIEDTCVLLDETGEDVLLLWPRSQTGWDPATETVLFERTDGTILKLRDGDLLRLGGGGNSTSEGGGTAESLVENVDWVSEPDDACLRDIVWAISDVERSTP